VGAPSRIVFDPDDLALSRFLPTEIYHSETSFVATSDETVDDLAGGG
jgi:hypothetical protein